MASYDDGQYHPWSPTTSMATAAPAATTTSDYDSPSSSSTSLWTSYSTSMSSSTSRSPSSSSSSSSSISTTTASSTFFTSSSTLSNPSTTLTRPTLASQTSSSTSSSGGFKLVYLLPVFILLPILAILSILGWTYGRCWGTSRRSNRSRGTSSPDTEKERRWHEKSPSENMSYKTWTPGRSVSGPQGSHDEDEEKALVEDEYRHSGGLAYEGGAGGWSNYLPPPLVRVLTHSSDPHSTPRYDSLETPFVPPSQSSAQLAQQRYLSPSDSHQRIDEEAGWQWGASPQGKKRKLRKGEGGLSVNAFGWGSKRYRAKQQSSLTHQASMRSVRSKASLADSISIYGGTSEGGHHLPYTTEGYAGLAGGEEEDLEADRKEKEEMERELDRILEESRVGNGELARRYLAGEVNADNFSPIRAEHRSLYEDVPLHEEEEEEEGYEEETIRPETPKRRTPIPSTLVSLPIPPQQSHSSPTKISHNLVRNATTPSRPTGGGALIFSYDSPERVERRGLSPTKSQSHAVIARNFSNPSQSPVPPSLLFNAPPSINRPSTKDHRPVPNHPPNERVSKGVGHAREPASEAPPLFTRQLASSQPSSPIAPPGVNPSPTRQPRRSSLNTSSFDIPIFADSPPLKPFAPSKVRHAIETIEARTTSPPPAPPHLLSSHSGSRTSLSASTGLTKNAKRYARPLGGGGEKLSVIRSHSAHSSSKKPEPTLIRSSTQLQTRTLPHYNEEGDEDTLDHHTAHSTPDTVEYEREKRISGLLLQRSKSAIEGMDSFPRLQHRSPESQRRPMSEYDQQRRGGEEEHSRSISMSRSKSTNGVNETPLTSDPKRLSTLLRKDRRNSLSAARVQQEEDEEF